MHCGSLLTVGIEMSGFALNENVFPGQGEAELPSISLLRDCGVWFCSKVALNSLR